MSRMAFGGNANRFPRPEDFDGETETDEVNPRCVWKGCRQDQLEGLQVCFAHGLHISSVFRKLIDADLEPLPPRPPDQPYVYYLMISPTTVKIGTTRNLEQRLSAMRSEAQYVVALERGSFDVERQRHKQFTAERRGAREDFHLSDALKSHIDRLLPMRDELMAEALASKRRHANHVT